MADRPRFGPAGVPPMFRFMGATLVDVPKLLREEGLDAFEYEAVRWGKKPQIKKEDAQKFGLQAKENDVWLSVHGSYFINLCGDKAIISASKQRLVACVTAASWMKAQIVVFHPGSYGEKSRIEALRSCSQALREIVAAMRTNGLENVRIGPETMGRIHQLGSLDEILTLCETIEHTQIVIDWSHLHARDRGRFKTAEDFRKVVEKVEERLGAEATRNMHCHFAKIEYTRKGERRHHTLEEELYGPDFEKLAEVIVEFKLRPTIISESPILDIDAMKMRDLLHKEQNKK